MKNTYTPDDILDFSANWNNKLANSAFTSIRLHNPKKYFAGKIFDIRLKQKTLGQAELVEVKTISLNQINNYIAYLDTGYDAEETKNIIRKIYKNFRIDVESAKFDFLLFKYLK